jgi:hypothetical protein
MSAHRTTVTLPASLYKEGLRRQKENHFATFSDYVAGLVRDDVLTHPEQAQESFSETPRPPGMATTALLAEEPASYAGKKKKAS